MPAIRNVIILGVGALGSLYGSRFYQAEHIQVHFLSDNCNPSIELP